MIRITELDGGDLGRGTFVTPQEFPLLALRVAKILRELRLVLRNGFSDDIPCYGFEIRMAHKDTILELMPKIKDLIGDDVLWYECDGKTLFEIRGASGGIVSSYICYLISR